MRLRFFHHVDELVEYLILNDYPLAWDRDDLSQALICEVLTSASERAGFVWFTWSAPDTLDFHVSIQPEHRGTWVTRRILQDIQSVARLCGAEFLSAWVALVPSFAERLGVKDQSQVTIRTEEIWEHLSLKFRSLTR